MSCIAVPKIPYPPGISLLLGLTDISIPVPTLGIKLCCNFSTPPIPGFPILLPLGAVPGIAVALKGIMPALMTYIDTVNATLDVLSFDCPLNP